MSFPRLRQLLAALALTTFSGSLLAEPASVLRIGYQKYGTLVLLRAKATLEPRLAREGVTVQWTEFPGGPQLLEGLNVGSIDFGVTGETPPVFAQAAGADLVYVANEPPAPTSEAILVPKDSAIRKVADLKGKKVGLNKGSNVHYLLVRALVHKPRLLLLDEPLGALDALTRLEMQQLIEQLWQELGFTVLLVTHDVSEAVHVADRILLIEDGRIGLDLDIGIPRPRRVGQAGLAALEARVLNQVLAQPDLRNVIPLRRTPLYSRWAT